MTIDELKKSLQIAISIDDKETSHSVADEALVEFLNQLDPEIGSLFEQVGKWFA